MATSRRAGTPMWDICNIYLFHLPTHPKPLYIKVYRPLLLLLIGFRMEPHEFLSQSSNELSESFSL